MVLITVERLEAAKEAIGRGLNCDCESLGGELFVTPEAVQWLKKEHYQLKVVESFGPTGIAVLIYPA